MTRRVTDPDDRPQDRPGFNRLHHICQLWVDFLTADDESQKHTILFEAVSHMALYRPQGAEGEDVLRQIVAAVRKRGRVYADARHWAVAHDDGYCSQMGIPRPYPFAYECSCGHWGQMSFADINHIDEVVACGRCSADVKIGLDLKVMERVDLQEQAEDRALVARLNRDPSFARSVDADEPVGGVASEGSSR